MKAIDILIESKIDENNPVGFKSIKRAIKKLSDQDAKKLLKYIDSLDDQTADQGLSKDKFGSMVGQLAGGQKSSTGGTTTQTPTGRKHTANPNNPNLQKTQQPAAQPVTPVVPNKGSNIKITGKNKAKPKLAVAV